jgi:hypothetical protein
MESFADSKTLYPFLHEPTASKIIKMEREREREREIVCSMISKTKLFHFWFISR